MKLEKNLEWLKFLEEWYIERIFPQMALVEMSQEELKAILEKNNDLAQ